MEVSKTQIQNMVKTALANKKINLSAKDAEKRVTEVISGILYHIAYFNSVDEYHNRVWDISFDDIMVIDEFKAFIQPKSIRFNSSDTRMANLKGEFSIEGYSDKDLSYDAFLKLQSEFRGWFKSDIRTDVSSVASLRTNMSLNDIFEHMSSNGWVNWSSADSYIPVVVKDEVFSIIGSGYFNTDTNALLDTYFSTAWYKLLK